MRRRAFGLETEYGVVVRHHSTSQYRVRLDVVPKVFVGRSFLRNGARRYVDVGNHPEYCTPECSTPQELVAHILAGDIVMSAEVAAFLVKWHQHPDNQGDQLDIVLYRNNICGYGLNQTEEAFGSHENYQFELPAGYGMASSLASLAPPLLPFLATRQLVVGNGRMYIASSTGRPSFELGQRSGFMEVETGTNTTIGRPIFNLRNEPHATGTGRLHVICGDNNFLPQLMELQFAYMDILLTMIEERRLRHMTLTDAVTAIRRVSKNPRSKIGQENGRGLCALDVLRRYHDQVWQFVDGDSDVADKRRYAKIWGSHLDRLARSLRAEDHVGQLAWATRKVMLTEYYLRHPQGDPQRLRAVDLGFNQVNGGRTVLSVMLDRYGQYDAEAVATAVTEAPTTTRAYVRGLAWAARKVIVSDWSLLGLESLGGGIAHLSLPDPLDPSIPDELLDYL